MIVVTADQLANLKPLMTERYQLGLVMDYLHDNRNKNVCALYGLRRAGKTTIMEQAINKLLSEGVKAENILYITGTKNQIEDIMCLYSEIDKKKSEVGDREQLYVFVDEIGYFMSFLSYSDRLYNYYTRICNMKIVIAGTNVLSLYIASMDTLYDRMFAVSVHHLTFYEHCRFVLETTFPSWEDFKNYLRIGGLFEQEDIAEYMQTSIIEHIQDTISCGEPREIMRWFDRYREDTDVNWSAVLNNICLYAAANIDERSATRFRGFADDIDYLESCMPKAEVDRGVIEECYKYYKLGDLSKIALRRNEVVGLLTFLEKCGFTVKLKNCIGDIFGNAYKMYLTFPFFRFSFTKKLADFAHYPGFLDATRGSRLLGDLLEGCVVSEYSLAYPKHEISFWRERIVEDGKDRYAECDLLDFTDGTAFEIKLKGQQQYDGFHYLNQMHKDWGFGDRQRKLFGEDAMQFVYDIGYRAYREAGS